MDFGITASGPYRGYATSTYRFGAFAVSGISANEILLDHVVTAAHVLPANFYGTQLSAGTPPASSFALTVLKNGTEVGSLVMDTAGEFTATTMNGDPIPISIGDVITVLAPELSDPSISRLRFTFTGVISG